MLPNWECSLSTDAAYTWTFTVFTRTDVIILMGYERDINKVLFINYVVYSDSFLHYYLLITLFIYLIFYLFIYLFIYLCIFLFVFIFFHFTRFTQRIFENCEY